MNPFALILLIATLALYARVWLPWGERASGNLVRRESLSLFGRLRMHGPGISVTLTGAAIALLLGLVESWLVLLTAALLAILPVVPMRYTLTAQGIQPGWTPFRRWTEFGGVARRPGGVRLQGVAGARPLTVWLSGDRDDDAFVHLLRQLVRGSYKGQLGTETVSPIAGATPGTIHIVGVGGS
jgi:hypothetical protein